MLGFRPGLPANRCSPTLEAVNETGLFTVSYRSTWDMPVLNWGGVTPITAPLVLNDPTHVRNASDKIRCLELLEGLVPPWWMEFTADTPLPVVAKTNFTWKGKGKRVIHDIIETKIRRVREAAGVRCRRAKLWKYDYFQQYIPDAQEFRVVTAMHGEHKRIIRCWEKIRPEGDNRIRPDWEFRNTRPTPPEAKRIAFEAIEKLQLSLVGFDVLMNSEGAWIIEANAAPGLNFHTARRIVKWLAKRDICDPPPPLGENEEEDD